MPLFKRLEGDRDATVEVLRDAAAGYAKFVAGIAQIRSAVVASGRAKPPR
jgi:hypothetical protein